MTLLVLAIIGMGVIFIASALDDTPILLTFQKILTGQPVDWTGTTGTLIMSPTGQITASTGPTPPLVGVAGTGKPGTMNASPAPAGGWFPGSPSPTNPLGGYQLPPVPIPTQPSGIGGSTTGVGSGWTRFAVTQAHGGPETGIDLGTPFHTPIGALASGKVVSASYGPWGGSVFVAVQNGAQTLYYNYLHLDQIAVQAGQSISPGNLIGLSGGQLSGGSHPAQAPYSTGAHTEFGIYTTPAISPSTALDPSQFYQFG